MVRPFGAFGRKGGKQDCGSAAFTAAKNMASRTSLGVIGPPLGLNSHRRLQKGKRMN
jgi:hypothetical protein